MANEPFRLCNHIEHAGLLDIAWASGSLLEKRVELELLLVVEHQQSACSRLANTASAAPNNLHAWRVRAIIGERLDKVDSALKAVFQRCSGHDHVQFELEARRQTTTNTTRQGGNLEL